ncbi:outer membrane beta-barrel protein [Lacinutrix sp. 5H-3-7-4]|uniref:outer membrane beta-barrel protein n=1 Tax=Lacinutrix sp. (strain 5H-3-7-4) TaxID=983544 RepID=UPI000A078060|nr:outer membrane beta-barrel protein [Lacinutrix sp. 5H-3-7-4]
MKKLLTLSFFLCSTILFSQMKYKKGHIIKKNGEKTNVLIKYQNKDHVPDFFNYKISKSDAKQEISIKEIKEIEIYNIAKYRTITADVDISGTKEIKLAPKDFFAEIIVEGKANLYYFKNKTETHFIYSVDNKPNKELIKKSFKKGELTGFNNDYIKKLVVDVNCNNMDIQSVKLKKEDLKNHFINYNECNNQPSKYIEKEQKTKFNVNIIGGINNSSLELDFSNYNSPTVDNYFDYGSKTTLTFGAEIEVIFPINNYKYSFISGLYYRSFEGETLNSQTSDPTSIKYNSIEIAVGARHYMYLNQNSKLFIDASGYVNLVNDNNITLKATGTQVDINSDFKTPLRLGLGLGYKYKKYGIAFKWFAPHNITNNYNVLTTSFKNTSLILSYNIL